MSRDFVISCANSPKTPRRIRLPGFVQFGAAALVTAGLGYGAYAHVSALARIRTLEQSVDAIAATEAYKSLQGELGIYRDHIKRMQVRLDHNYAQIVSLLADSNPISGAGITANPQDRQTVAFVSQLRSMMESGRTDADPRAAISDKRLDGKISFLLGERQRMNKEMSFLASELDQIISRRIARLPETETQTVQRAMIQRDLAAYEARELRQKVAVLESMVTDMQIAQIMIFEKVGTLADDGIKTMETKLADVRRLMDSVGLGFEWLVSRAADPRGERKMSQGGPLVPLSVGNDASIGLRTEQFRKSYDKVNTQVERWDNLSRLMENLPLGWPIKSAVRITSGFGARIDPVMGHGAVHEGIDLAAMRGEPIYTTGPGRVVFASSAGAYGLMVEIDHGYGIRTRYAHMNRIDVRVGDRVVRGQRIGEVGNTGRSTGPHLHYEVRVRGRPVNPLRFTRTQL